MKKINSVTEKYVNKFDVYDKVMIDRAFFLNIHFSVCMILRGKMYIFLFEKYFILV